MIGARGLDPTLTSNPVVDIVIPVHGGAEATRRCLASVLAASSGQTRHEIVVIDDASPDPEIVACLDGLAAEQRITLIRNRDNLGFVRTVNIGMALHPDRDVVLLNSDTEVAHDWLDRLRRCAHGQPDIGTVTPFSNNATICSYPAFCEDNTLPPGVGPAELDAVFARVNAGEVLDIPTAVGFCMYIRRDCLSRVGPFDADRFGRGYGEENDFCCRALQAGWRNVLCADTFVFHQGSVSFGAERKALLENAETQLRALYPDYLARVGDFILRDPAERFRRRVEIELARARFEPGRRAAAPPLAAGAVAPVCYRAGDGATGLPAFGTMPVQLHVVHDLGGGVERWYTDYCRADRSRINLILKPFCHGAELGKGLMLYAGAGEATPIALWLFAAPVNVATVTHGEYKAALAQILAEYCVDGVIVSSLIGHSLDVLDTGLPTVVVTHDFFPACPAVNTYFNGLCAQCDADRLRLCQAGNTDFNLFAIFPAEDPSRVQARFCQLAASGRFILAAPNRSAQRRLWALFPSLREAAWATIPHGHAGDFAPIRHGQGGGRLKIIVLGTLSISKGLPLFTEAVDRLTEFADIYLVGSFEFAECFRDRPGIHIVVRYALDELPGLVEWIQPDAGLLLSIWPETYSYTLTELMRLGIPPVATNLGSFQDRILDGDTGFLFEPDADALVALLGRLDADRAALMNVHRNLLKLPRKTTADMVEDYHQLLPLAISAPKDWPPPRGAGDPAGAEVVIAQAMALIAMWRDAKKLIWTADARQCRIRRLELDLAEAGRLLDARQGEIAASGDALREAREQAGLLRQQLAAVLGSTSWAVSAPVRWLGMGLRKTRAGLRGLAARLHGQPRPVSGPDAAPAAIPAPELPRLDRIYRRYRASLDDPARAAIRERIQAMARQPLISVLMRGGDTPAPLLAGAIESVRAQLYPAWELCLVDDGPVAARLAAMDPRIRPHPGRDGLGPAGSLNQALAMARGEFALVLEARDLLEEEALFRIAEAILADAPDLLYTDALRVSEDASTVERFELRPTFSPEYLRAHPYIDHLVAGKTALLRAIGGFDEAAGAALHHDLVLRASEVAGRIVHIPEMLYRRRAAPDETTPSAIERITADAGAAVIRHLERRGEKGRVGAGGAPGFFDIRYPLAAGLRVAIVIPTRNHGEMVRTCIESIERTVREAAYDIVLIDHESDEPASLACFDSLRDRVRVLQYRGPFNFSAINNWAVAQLPDIYSHYLFCNNDVEAIQPGWLERMLELGQMADVGMVGAKLYYPDHATLQHAGVCIGSCGVAENLGRFLPLTGERPDAVHGGVLIANHEVSSVTGACMLAGKAAFRAIGGFDEELAVGFGDVDLCLRAGEAGYRVLFCPHAELLHHESYTRGRSPVDPHPLDTARFVAKWQKLYVTGDPYFSPGLSLQNPHWELKEPLEFRLDVQRRVHVSPSRPAG